MDRRTFIGTSAAAIASTALPLYAYTPTETIYDKILQSFPKLGDDGTAFLLTTYNNGHFLYENVAVQRNDWIENESFEEFVNAYFMPADNMKALENNRHYETILAMNRASNAIAVQSRRGRGREYAVLDEDTVLVWYKGFIDSDTPIYTNGNSFYFNPNYQQYFKKINGISISDSDHEILKEIGYNKIA